MTNEAVPAVSVVIPLYNHEKYIGEAIASVLSSSFGDFEIVVVDDGSTDGSAEIAKSVGDGRIRFFQQANAGAHEAINRGVSLARAPWIAILNSDDRFHPLKLERHLHLHRRHPDLEASASRVRYIFEDGRAMPRFTYPVQRYVRLKRLYSGSGDLFPSLLLANHLITTSCLFVRKRVFSEVGGFIPLRYVHDRFMFLTLAAGGRFRVLEEDLVDYRRHAANTIRENDYRGRVEDNFVLAWHLFNSLHEERGDYDLTDWIESIDRNKRACPRLILMFEAWRRLNGGDLVRTAAIFNEPDHPVMQQALRMVEQGRGTRVFWDGLKGRLGNVLLRATFKAVKALGL
ncbi:MAG: glycosyltransferase [Pseudomonadota bacterium]